MRCFPSTAARPRPGSSREWWRSPREILSRHHSGYPAEGLCRPSDPFWFQAFGCVLGFDTGIRAASRPLSAARSERVAAGDRDPSGASSPPEAREPLEKKPCANRRRVLTGSARDPGCAGAREPHGRQARQRRCAGRLSPVPSRFPVFTASGGLVGRPAGDERPHVDRQAGITGSRSTSRASSQELHEVVRGDVRV